MQIFNLQIYNDKLDALLWDNNGNLKPVISNLLLKVATDFYRKQKLRAPILDIVLLGSSAGYNYSSTSDIDVHVIIDFDDLNMEYDDAKHYVDSLKNIWNKKHKLHIRDRNIEMYIQDVDDLLDTHAAGIYSLLKSRWLKRPTKDKVEIDKEAIKKMYVEWADKVNNVITNPSFESIEKIMEEIYKLREKGLQSVGEYSKENIVFKLLRSNKFIERLEEVKVMLYDKQMSLDEANVGDITIKRVNDGNRITFYALCSEPNFGKNMKIGKIIVNKELISGYYTIMGFIIFDESQRGNGIGRVLLNAIFNDSEISKKPILIQPYPYDDKTEIKDLVSMYKHFGFREWEDDKRYMIYDKHLK